MSRLGDRLNGKTGTEMNFTGVGVEGGEREERGGERADKETEPQGPGADPCRRK